jgi:hypothetical protein
MGTAEMQEIPPHHRDRPPRDDPHQDRSRTGRLAGKPSLANYTLEEGARAQAEGRARDLLERFPLYPEIEL